MKSGVFLLAGAMLLCSLATVAQPYPVPGLQRPHQQADLAAQAAATVKEGMEALIKFMAQKPRPTSLKLAVFLEEHVASRFDFQRMARMSLGPAYRGLSDERAADLEQKIEQHFLRSLVKKLAAFEQQKVRFFRPRRAGFNQAIVTVGIADPGGYPARFDFRLYLGKDGWKVYDVAANGRSVVAFYRRHFARRI